MTKQEIEHIILPGLTLKREEPIVGETITEFLERTQWDFRIPTVCSLNNLPVLRKEWATTTISAPDKICFISKPHGRGGGGGKMNNVFALVAVVALAVVAPWVAGSIFAAGSLGFYATVAAITVGGGLLIQSFLAPKPAKSSDPESIPQMYSLTASGNTANPLQPIPVQYGRLKTEPPYASIPWGEFIGDDQYLNILLCQGMGIFDLEQILIDDTVLWDKNTGLSPSFTDVQFQFCPPDVPVTLFPSNVVAAAEVDGQSVSETYLGGYIANAAGTKANALAFDFVWPGGLFSTSEDDAELHNATVTLWLEGRRVDDSGTPITSWSTLLSPVVTLNTRSPKRMSYKIDLLPEGRWEGRVRRTNAESTDTKKSDAVQWAQFRAFLVGSTSYPDVSLIAIRIKATAQLSQTAAKKIGVIQTKILPVWNGTAFVSQPTKNAFWAFYDCATNQKYGAGLSPSRVDFQEIYAQALAADARGDSFNYVFDSAITFQEAFDTILGSCRTKPAWIGDVLSVTRDEWKPIPQMLLTDQQTVRGSVSVDYIINDDTYADCVTGQFLNENTWGPAQLQYPPNSLEFTGVKPATVQIPGVTNPTQMMHELGFLYRQAQLRRINVTLDTEHDGRLLRFGSSVRVQSNLPTKWGQSGEIKSYNTITRVMVVDRDLIWTTGQTHYLELRDRGGHYWGPVAVAKGSEDNQLIVNASDLEDVEEDLDQTLPEALDRLDGAEPPAFAFGIAGEFARSCIVLSGKPQDDKVTLNLAVDSAAVHDDSADPAPVLPTAPILVDPRVPIVAFLTATFRQGVIEPILDATWWPAPGALYYRAAVSYDGGTSWLALPDVSEPQLTAVVSRAALRLRVAAVGIMHGPWVSVDLEAPDIVLGDDTVGSSSLKRGLRDYVEVQLNNALTESRNTLQRIAAIAAEHDASRTVEDIAIRQSLTAVSARGKASVDFLTTVIADLDESFAQYRVTVAAQFDDLGALVETNATAIADANSAFSSYQITVAAQFDTLTAYVDLTASAVADVDGRVDAAVVLTLDVNGYISGWESTNDGTSSTFGIIASRFYIAEPGVSGGALIPVFTIATVNGSSKLAFRGDMFIDGILTTRMFSALSVKSAAIDSDSIETRHLTINSVGINELILNAATYIDVTAFSSPWGPENPLTDDFSSSWTSRTFFSKTVTIRSGRAMITCQCSFSNYIAAYSSSPTSTISLYVNGILRRQWAYKYAFNGGSTWQLTDPITIGWVVEGLPDGANGVTFTITNGPGMNDGQVYIVDLRR